MRTFRHAASFHLQSPAWPGLVATLGCLATLLASAPLAAQSTATTGTAKPVDQTGVHTAPARHAIGDATHLLLDLQTSGRLSSPAQPVLGDEAAAAYKRYIDSFSHPIPAYFQTMVGQRSGSGGANGGL